MTNHRERAQQIITNYTPDSVQAALVHAVLDLADAIREGHTPPAPEFAERPPDDLDDRDGMVVLFVQQQPDCTALLFTGTRGIDVVSPRAATLLVMRTPVSQGGTGEDYLVYTNDQTMQLVARKKSIYHVRRHLLLHSHGTTVAMPAGLAARLMTPSEKKSS